MASIKKSDYLAGVQVLSCFLGQANYGGALGDVGCLCVACCPP